VSDDHGCDPVSLDGPDAAAAAGRLGVLGFVALWRGQRPAVASLCDDAAVVEAQMHAGRLEVDDAGLLVGVHGLVARTTRHRIDHTAGAVHTWCALDAIGIPAALAIDATAVVLSDVSRRAPSRATRGRTRRHRGAVATVAARGTL
jgi:hypothetical protein